jgi:hypothetical protein
MGQEYLWVGEKRCRQQDEGGILLPAHSIYYISTNNVKAITGTFFPQKYFIN